MNPFPVRGKCPKCWSPLKQRGTRLFDDDKRVWFCGCGWEAAAEAIKAAVDETIRGLELAEKLSEHKLVERKDMWCKICLMPTLYVGRVTVEDKIDGRVMKGERDWFVCPTCPAERYLPPPGASEPVGVVTGWGSSAGVVDVQLGVVDVQKPVQGFEALSNSVILLPADPKIKRLWIDEQSGGIADGD